MKTGIIIDLLALLTLKQGNVRSIGSGERGYKDGVSEEASFNSVAGITHSKSDGYLLVCDFNNHKIRKITFIGIWFLFILWIVCLFGNN